MMLTDDVPVYGPTKRVAAIATVVFPILLTLGFLMHPRLLYPSMTLTAADLAAKFHHRPSFHVGHLIVFAAVPAIILSLAHFMGSVRGRGRRFALAGGLTGIIGAVILAGDKGALCLVLSAFDSLPETDFQAIFPALQAIVDRAGLLKVFWLLPLLPVGAMLQLIALIMEKRIRRALGIVGIAGLALLNNPDIDIVSSIGGILMCCAYVPLGLGMLRRRRRPTSVAAGSVA